MGEEILVIIGRGAEEGGRRRREGGGAKGKNLVMKDVEENRNRIII